ncbi:MAG: bifunctional UDP-N-acetylmuramoyl-tripeptide:D-alanyl-D-alanine ligase/alanine racemase [Chitinophagales bacterium]
MNYSISHIADILESSSAITVESTIEHLLLDSRKVYSPASSLFFALKGPRRDGHQFITELYKKGVRNFIGSEKIEVSVFPGANFILVDDTLIALQQLAAYHRRQFSIPVIGITGSNGKTIVKEWLYQLMHEDFDIVRSPKSYNSQIGVPLSVWQMNEHHTLAIFEAGISQQGEMARLERIIQPTLGILTNIGEAHSEGFIDSAHKFREKLALFKNCKMLIGRDVDFESQQEFLELLGTDLHVLTWGVSDKNEFVVKGIKKNNNETIISLFYRSGEKKIIIPFIDDASVENAITCFCALLHMGISDATIEKRMKNLQPVNMRLELKKGINHCVVINDSYSADLSSLNIALNFLEQQSADTKKTVILSDFLQSGMDEKELYFRIAEALVQHKVSRVIGIGDQIGIHLREFLENFVAEQDYFSTTDSFVRQFRASKFKEEAVLVKGARVFEFEKIVQLLEQKVHQTILEINLDAIAHNLKQYQQLLKPSTKVMAMVKAFAYGSGGAEIAGILQYNKVDYLGVAYADEGVELRKAGITIPVMVMNPDENSFDTIIENNLEPEIYSFDLLNALNRFLQKETLQQYPVHIEIETGMNRLGFAAGDMEKLANFILSASSFKVQSVFSHLAASEDPGQDKFTLEQFNLYEQAAQQLQDKLGYSFLRHIANSAAIIRHPQLQLDMVRPGIGLYGIDSAETGKLNLQTVATLKSTIAQLKFLEAGESVSYNRSGVVNRNSIIATVRIGYADGYPRRLGNAVGKMLVKARLPDGQGKQAPITGNVCMDMTMIDVTDIPGVHEGDEVILFGKELPVQQLARWAQTIPYEIMTGISQRVKRIYYEE